MLLEWDAAMFNEYVAGMDESISGLTSAINATDTKQQGGKDRRRELLQDRKRITAALADRVRLFWYGRELDDGSNRDS